VQLNLLNGKKHVKKNFSQMRHYTWKNNTSGFSDYLRNYIIISSVHALIYQKIKLQLNSIKRRDSFDEVCLET